MADTGQENEIPVNANYIRDLQVCAMMRGIVLAEQTHDKGEFVKLKYREKQDLIGKEFHISFQRVEQIVKMDHEN